MPWTESRSRDEWLAEVRRRGERIRRRRRLALSAVCAVALLGPAFAMVTRSAGDDGARQLQVAAGGPSPTAAATGPSVPTAFGEADAIPTTTALAGAVPLPDVTAPSGPLYSSTTTAVQRHESSISSVPPADDPVVRAGPTTTTAPSEASGSPASSPLSATASSASPEPALCAAAEVRVTVSTEKSTYGPGETVRGSSTIQNRSAGPCLLPTFVPFQILNGAGEEVFQHGQSHGYSADPRSDDSNGRPVKAEPGGTLTSTFYWESRTCSYPPVLTGGSTCAQFPPGTYTVVALWGGTVDGGAPRYPYSGRTTFQIAA